MAFNVRILFILVIFLIAFNPLHAQRITDPAFKRFGLLAGINVANMNFNRGFPTPDVSVPATWKSGVMIGLLTRIPLTKKFYLQPEYCYLQRRGSDRSIGMNYLANYFSLPILLNYRISPRFTASAGPQLELLIAAKEYNADDDKSITHDMEERSIAVTAGLTAKLYKSLDLSARYFQGLNHIGIGQRSDVKEFKYQAINLSLETSF